MIEIIKNEFTKLFHKKSFLILLIIILIYVLLTNILYDNNAFLVTEKNASISIIKNFYYEYDILIVLSILLLTCPILSGEYNNRTIKNLLLIPKSRTKILLSKYFCVLISLIFIIGFIFASQMIISVFFDKWSLSNLIIHYNKSYTCFSWFVNVSIYKCLYYYILMSFVFLFSTLCHNNSSCTIASIVFYLSSDFLKNILFNSTFFLKKYLWFMNLDIEKHFVNNISGVGFSVTIILLYCLIALLLSILVFNKKDIKNL